MLSERALLSQIRPGQNVIGCLAGIRKRSSVSLFQSTLGQASCQLYQLRLHRLRGDNQRVIRGGQRQEAQCCVSLSRKMKISWIVPSLLLSEGSSMALIEAVPGRPPGVSADVCLSAAASPPPPSRCSTAAAAVLAAC